MKAPIKNGSKPKLFKNDLPLPPDLEWEHMEAGILDKLSIIQAQKKSKKKRWGFLFFLFLLGSSGLIYNWTGLEDKPLISSETFITSPTPYKFEPIKNAGSSSKTISGEAELSPQNFPFKTAPTAASSRHKSTTTTTTLNQFPDNSALNTSSQDLNPSRISILNKPSIDLNDIEEQLTQTLWKGWGDKVNIANSKLSEPLFGDHLISPISPISPISQNLIALPNPLLFPQLSFSKHHRTDQKLKFFPCFNRLSLAVGSSLFQANYSGDNQPLAAIRNSSERLDPGFQIELSYERQVGKHIFLGTGGHYQHYRSLLDTRAELNFDREQTNVVVRENMDPITQQSSQTLIDTTIGVIQLRQIRHYNSHRSIEIPFYVGWQMGQGRVSFSLLSGISTSLYRTRQGRAFNQDFLISPLEDMAENPYRSGLAFALMGGAQFNYALRSNSGLIVRASYKHFITNWISAESGLSSKPRSLQLSIGSYLQF